MKMLESLKTLEPLQVPFANGSINALVLFTVKSPRKQLTNP